MALRSQKAQPCASGTALVDRIIEAARLAPTSSGLRHFEVIVESTNPK